MSEVHRKRMRRREALRTWRFLTFSCYRRLPLLGHPAIRDLMAASIESSRQRCGFSLAAWVIMPEHLHLMLGPTRDEWPVPKILVTMKQPVAQTAIRRWRRLRAPVLNRITDEHGQTRFWQEGGGFDRNVRDDEEFAREITYIHMNPVRRNLVESPTDWPWSSARWYAGDRSSVVQIAH